MLVNNWDIHHFGEVESTNLIVKEQIRKVETSLLKPKPCGYVAVAKSQTGGRGMRGHTWSSPEGGLYFSLLLDPSLPHEKLPEIPLRIANVVMSALQPLSTAPLTIKPPNDIVLAGSTAEHPSRIIRSSSSQNSLQDTLPSNLTSFPTYSMNKSSEGSQCEGLTNVSRSATAGSHKVEKLVGISTEMYMSKLCVGIGINIFHPKETIHVEGENIPVYLEDFSTKKLNINSILNTVLEELNAKLEI